MSTSVVPPHFAECQSVNVTGTITPHCTDAPQEGIVVFRGERVIWAALGKQLAIFADAVRVEVACAVAVDPSR